MGNTYNITKHTFSHNVWSKSGTTFLWQEFHTATPPLSFHIKTRLFLTHSSLLFYVV